VTSWPRTVLAVLWIALAVLSWAFSTTDGLAYDGGPGAHVSDLESSGSDDDALISMGAVLAIVALLWTAARARRPFRALDVAVHGGLVFVQVFYVGLIALDDGSLPLTILRDRNWALAAWLGTLAALAGGVVLAAVTERAARE
jgi:hypothetical protein